MIIRQIRFLLIALCLTACANSPAATENARAQASQPNAEHPRGMGRFIFEDWAGPAIPVWTYRPAAAGPNAPILFVFHGVQRDADRYLREWTPLAERLNVVIVCPEFSQATFPRALGYNLGGVLDEASQPRPANVWAFSAIEPIFAAVRRVHAMSTPRMQIYGHSAGAQFVHRLMMFAPPASAERVVIANAGWYTRPRFDIAWPYGLRGAPITPSQLNIFLQRNVTVLLGTADNDPQHPSLNREPESLAQGPHRLARGELYFEEARAAAQASGVAFGWRKAYAPGIGHDNGKMADFAAPILFGASQ